LEDDVLFALLIDEIPAPDLGRRLQLSVDASVALLQPHRIPGKVDMNEVVTAPLEIDALTRCVRADEYSQRVLCRIRVEATLQLLAAVKRRRASERRDPVVGLQIVERFGYPRYDFALMNNDEFGRTLVL
jgi:hypothetical protein